MRHDLLRWALLGLMLLGGRVRGEGFGEPGAPLHRTHQGLACETCHVAQGDAPAQKCLGCHPDVATAQRLQKGLHGHPKVRGKTCASCHREHRGTDADLRGFRHVEQPGTQRFDHTLTGFDLEAISKHALNAEGKPRVCEDCHRQKTATGRTIFSGSARTCKPCHADFHEGSRLKDCIDCHRYAGQSDATAGKPAARPEPKGEQSIQPLVGKSTTPTRWWAVGFDHNTQTGFPLVGPHRRGAQAGRCVLCHPASQAPAQFAQEKTCGAAPCHKRDDRHEGRWPQCQQCHKETRFSDVALAGPRPEHQVSPEPLAGAHNRVACRVCHTDQQRTLRGMANQCASCHQRDDIHHNALGPRCGDCHNQQTFAQTRFSHATVGCTLRGIHRALPCVDCHKGGNYAGLTPMCVGCHRDDAMRAAALGNTSRALHVGQTACTHCHNTTSFRQGLTSRAAPPESVCQ